MIYGILGLGNEAKSSVVSAQQRLNVYFEPRPDGDKQAMSAYGTPGLDLFGTLGSYAWRGFHVANGRFFGVVENGLYEVSTTGSITFLGSILTSTGRVGMADNGLQLMIADGFGYILNLTTNLLTQITSPGYPANTADVTYQDGYFIVPSDNGQFYVSAILNGLVWDATDFATAESNPDALQRVYATNGELVLFGALTTEFWGNSGGAQFPYTNLRGSTLQWALAAPWTLADYDQSLMGLWRNAQGGLIVGVLKGYDVQRVSNPDVESAWEKLDVTQATAFSYFLNGHPFYQVNFPTRSFLYDGLTGLWSDVQGYGIQRHRAEHGKFWPGVGFLVADYDNGNIYKLNQDGTSDDGDPIIRRIRGRHLFNESQLVSISSLVVDMATGENSIVDNPQVMLRVSKDGGRTWAMERWESLGKVGEYKARAKWRRLGMARDWLFEITVSDPVKFAVNNAYVDVV